MRTNLSRVQQDLTKTGLPATWAEADFSTLFETISTDGKKIPQKQYKQRGKVPIVDQGAALIGGFTDDESTKICSDGPVIVFGDHTRIFKYIDFDFAPGADGIKVLRPLLIEPRYAFYISQALPLRNKGYARHYQDLRKCMFPIAPYGEQFRIIDKLDELFSGLDAGVASLKRAKALLKKYRQAVLKAAVTGELTRDWRERHQGEIRESGAELLQRILTARRQAWEAAELKKLRAKGKPPRDDRWKQKYKEPQPPDITGLPALPEGWTVASTDQVMTHITSGSRAWSKYYGTGTGTFILAQNIRPRRLDLSVRQPVDPPKHDPERVRTEVHHLDVLVTIVGANTGDVCQVNQPLIEHYVCQSVALLRPAIPEMSHFSQLYLSADGGGQDQYKRYIYGAGRPHLSFDQLRATAIPVPSLEEQMEIVELVDGYFSVFDFLEGAVETELRRSGAFRQSVLKAAFSGKLVPQDPNDEPASVLLARIRAERAVRPTRGLRTGDGSKFREDRLDLAFDCGDTA